MATISINPLEADQLIEDAAGGGITYYGFSSNGNFGTASTEWAILREQVVGSVTTYRWAGGTKQEKYAWDDRATLTY